MCRPFGFASKGANQISGCSYIRARVRVCARLTKLAEKAAPILACAPAQSLRDQDTEWRFRFVVEDGDILKRSNLRFMRTSCWGPYFWGIHFRLSCKFDANTFD